MSHTPPPSSDESLREIARQLIDINKTLLLMKGWMEGQEEITNAHKGSLGELERTVQMIYDVGKPYVEKVDRLVTCVERMDQTLLGVTELAKSTYDMVESIKGGDNGGKKDNQQSAERTAP